MSDPELQTAAPVCSTETAIPPDESTGEWMARVTVGETVTRVRVGSLSRLLGGSAVVDPELQTPSRREFRRAMAVWAFEGVCLLACCIPIPLLAALCGLAGIAQSGDFYRGIPGGLLFAGVGGALGYQIASMLAWSVRRAFHG